MLNEETLPDYTKIKNKPIKLHALSIFAIKSNKSAQKF